MGGKILMEHIGVCIIVENSEGKVLLGMRKNGYKQGLYGMPGGRVERDESLMTCCEREVSEETGLEIEKVEFVGVVREFQQTYTFIHFGFVCKNVSEVPKNMEPDKCEGWDWYEPDQLPENLLPGHSAVIQMYRKGECLTDPKLPNQAI